MRSLHIFTLAKALLLSSCASGQRQQNAGDVFISGEKTMSMGRGVICGITTVNGKDVTSMGVPNFDLYTAYGLLRLEGECTKVYESSSAPREKFKLTFNEFNAKPGEKFTITGKIAGDAGVKPNVPLTAFIRASDGGIAAVAEGQKVQN